MVKRAYTPINNLNAWLMPSAPAAPVAAAPAGSGRMAEPYVSGKFPKLDAGANTSNLEGKSSELVGSGLYGERWRNYQKGENAVAGVGRVGKGKDGALYLSPDGAARERASARADELDRQQWSKIMRDKLKELRKGNTEDQLELGGAFNKSNVVTPDWMDYIGFGPWGLGNRRIPFTGNDVCFKLIFDFNTDKAKVAYSLDGNSWTIPDYELQMRYTLDYFTGYRPAIYCYNSTGVQGGKLAVDWFHQEQKGL